MTKKIVIEGILGGLVMFIWSFVVHMALPLAEMGVKTIPNEEAVIAVMKANIKEPGFYFFPGEGAMASEKAAQEAWKKKYEAGPRGVMVYHPTGATPFSARQMILEYISDVIVAMIAAFMLLMASDRVRSFFGRVVFVTLLSVASLVAIEFSYWNWYGYPLAYEAGQLLDQVVGMALTGVLFAFLMRKV